MKENQEQMKKIDHDERGNPIMTVKTIKYYCYKDSLYETPQLNQKLYLHFKGFKKIQALQNYPNLVTIWLNNNCISEISGLNSLKNLVCLHLNNNVITKISNLEGLENLSVLNLAHNKIQKIENLSCLPSLHTLNVSENFLSNCQSLQGALQCNVLSNLNLSKNQIQNTQSIMSLICKLSNMTCLYLKATPLARGYKYYRKTLIAGLKKLKFLDDRPIQQIDHRIFQAWMRGGSQEEKAERKRISQQKQELQKRQSEQTNVKVNRENQRQNEKKLLQQKKKQLLAQNKEQNTQKLLEIEQRLEILNEGPKGYQAAITNTAIKVLHVADHQQDKIINEYFASQKQKIEENIKDQQEKEKEQRFSMQKHDEKYIQKKVRRVLKLGDNQENDDESELHKIQQDIKQNQERVYQKYWDQKYLPLLQALLQKYKFDFHEVQPSFNMVLANINKKMIRPHRRFQVEELQKIWTGVQIQRRKKANKF